MVGHGRPVHGERSVVPGRVRGVASDSARIGCPGNPFESARLISPASPQSSCPMDQRAVHLCLRFVCENAARAGDRSGSRLAQHPHTFERKPHSHTLSSTATGCALARPSREARAARWSAVDSPVRSEFRSQQVRIASRASRVPRAGHYDWLGAGAWLPVTTASGKLRCFYSCDRPLLTPRRQPRTSASE